MSRVIVIAFICFSALVGCGSLGPKTASLHHASYKALIQSDFSRDLWIPLAGTDTGAINIFSIDEAQAPKKYLNIYCNRDGGQLFHVKLDEDVYARHKPIRELTGVFSCKDGAGGTLWSAEVDARRHRGGLERGGTPGYLFRVIDVSR